MEGRPQSWYRASETSGICPIALFGKIDFVISRQRIFRREIPLRSNSGLEVSRRVRSFILKLTSSRAWSDRIPFVLLFGISTSIDSFKDKLSLGVTSHLRSMEFSTDPVDSEHIFQAIISPKISCPWLGPNISRAILHPGNDQARGISYFSRSLKASRP